MLRKPERFSLYFNGVLKALRVCACTHMAAARFYSFFFPFLPLQTCLAFSLHRMFRNVAPSSTAPACPLPAFRCAPTSPYPSIWCSQLFKKKYQLACMKSKREREIKGNCGNKALQKALTSQVFLAGRLVASLGHLPGTRASAEKEDRGWSERSSVQECRETTAQKHHLLPLLLGTGRHASTQVTGLDSRTVG